MAKYVEALCTEIREYAKKYRDRTVTSVFFGGGTPSILPVELTGRIFEALRDWSIDSEAEITVECNPGTVTKEKLMLYRTNGVNRLSFGLQSVNNDELAALGRIHTFEDFITSYEMAKDVGFNNINIDLISAIPGQSAASWEKTLRTVAELNPEHISAYSLIIEEGTPFYELYSEGACKGRNAKRGVLPLPDEDTEREIYSLTDRVLREYGYHRYEISNYSKEKLECRHNLGYWMGEEYLGCGLGASSYVDNMRYKNTDDIAEYLAPETDIHKEIEVLNKQDLISEYIILHLRLVKGLSCREFKTKFGADIHELYGNVLEKYVKAGLLLEKDGYVMLTEKGFDLSNIVMAEFV